MVVEDTPALRNARRLTPTPTLVCGDVRCVLGESPVWRADEAALYWVDVRQAHIHRWDTRNQTHQRWDAPDVVGCILPRRGGGFVAAVRGGLRFFDPNTGAFTDAVHLEPDLPENRYNDGGVDPAGRIWIGTMANNLGPDGGALPIVPDAGSLYRVEADLSATRVATGFGVPNTLAWPPGGQRMLFGDSEADTLYSYRYDAASGSLDERRPHLRRPGPGVPDGSALDAEGHLWNARWDGHCVLRVAPDGTIDAVLQLPVARPTCCAFGGPDNDTLFITTASDGLDADALARQPLAGAVLAVKVDVQGAQTHTFAG